MNKYKITYYNHNNEVLDTYFVNSSEMPQIINYDSKKYVLDDNYEAVKVDDNSFKVDIQLKPRIEHREIDIYINNTKEAKLMLKTNYAEEKISINVNGLELKNASGELSTNDGIHYSGLVPIFGYEVKYSILSKSDQRLNIFIRKIIFENTTGELVVDDEGNLGGLIPHSGYQIQTLKLLENNEVDFKIIKIESDEISKSLSYKFDKISLVDEFSSQYYQDLDKTKTIDKSEFSKQEKSRFNASISSRKKFIVNADNKLFAARSIKSKNKVDSSIVSKTTEDKHIKEDLINEIKNDYFDTNNSFTKDLKINKSGNNDKKEDKKLDERIEENKKYNNYVSNLHTSGSVTYSLLKSLKSKKSKAE